MAVRASSGRHVPVSVKQTLGVKEVIPLGEKRLYKVRFYSEKSGVGAYYIVADSMSNALLHVEDVRPDVVIDRIDRVGKADIAD